MKRTESLTRYKLTDPRHAFRTAPTGEAVRTEGEAEQPQGGQEQGQGKPQGGEEKPLTPEEQARVDAAVEATIQERLGRQKASLAKEAAEAKKREGMAEAERLQAEKADLEAKVAAAEQDAKEARWEAQAAPHVIDTETALFVIKANPEKYVGSDGKVKVSELLKDKPFLKRVKDQSGPGTGGRTGEGGDPKTDLDAAMRADRAAGRRK